MTSILDNISAMRQDNHSGCGGTVLVGGSEDQRHQYCDRCGAYTYDMDAELPTGTDRTANRAALDAGEDRSPDAETAPSITVNVYRNLGEWCYAMFGADGFDHSDSLGIERGATERDALDEAAEQFPDAQIARVADTNIA